MSLSLKLLVDKIEKESTMRTILIVLLYFVKEFKQRAAFSQVELVVPVACLEILSDSSLCLTPPGCVLLEVHRRTT